MAAAIGGLAMVLAIVAPGYFSAENLRDLFLANLPVLLVAIGMTLVIVAGEIDISVGSVFAICAVAAGVLAKAGMPVWLASAAACLLGALFGSINGALVAYRHPVDRCHARDDGGAARRAALDDGGRLGSGPSAGVPVAGAHPG